MMKLSRPSTHAANISRVFGFDSSGPSTRHMIRTEMAWCGCGSPLEFDVTPEIGLSIERCTNPACQHHSWHRPGLYLDRGSPPPAPRKRRRS